METNLITDFVKGDNFVMDYCRFGNGAKTLVLLPGVSLMPVTPLGELVAKQYHLFHEGFTTYLFDRKRDITTGYSVDDMARDTALAMKALGIKDACIIGCSQGGMIAQIIAARHPELVSKMALCSTTMSINDTTVIGEWAALADKGDVVALNRSFFKYVYSEEFQRANAKLIKNIENVGTPEDMARLKVLAQACLDFDARPLHPSIKCPVLVVTGAQDKVFSTESQRRLAQSLAAQHIIYDTQAHAVYDEAQDLHHHFLEFFQ